jgi:hypothetical protein
MGAESGASVYSVQESHSTLPIYSVRIDRDWRAVGAVHQGAMVWFWIGPHDEYERLLSSL